MQLSTPPSPLPPPSGQSSSIVYSLTPAVLVMCVGGLGVAHSDWQGQGMGVLRAKSATIG
jgi:hypothetical protein